MTLRLPDALGLRHNGRNALLVRLNGQTVWEPDSPPEPGGGFGIESSVTSGTDSSGTLTIDRPAGAQEGDLLLALVGTYATTQNSSIDGFTHRIRSGADNNNFRPGICVLTKAAGSSEPSTYEVVSGGPSVSATILRIAGADVSSPIGEQSESNDGGGTALTTITVPSLTGTSGRLLLHVTVAYGSVNVQITVSLDASQDLVGRYIGGEGTSGARHGVGSETLDESGATGTRTHTTDVSRRLATLMFEVVPA
jgi:hypothetical protein